MARYPAPSSDAMHRAIAGAQTSPDGGTSASVSFRLTAFGARRLGVARFGLGEPFAATLLVTTTSGQRLVERLQLRS